MVDLTSFRTRLEVIAYGLGRLEPFDAAGRHALWADLRLGAIGEHPTYGLGIGRRSTLDGWFGEGRVPQGDNRHRLAVMLGDYAKAQGRTFEDDWLTMPVADLAERLGVDLTALEVVLEQGALTQVATTIDLPFRIATDRAVRLRQKYAGKYFAYRLHAAREVVVREVLVIGSDVVDGIGQGVMTDYRHAPYSFRVVPTHQSLAFYLFEGEGGDSFRAEAMIMRRKKSASRAHAAVRVRLSESIEQPLAVKVLLFKQPGEAGPVPETEAALEALKTEGGEFGPGTDVYQKLAPWLVIDPGPERSGYRDFGKNALWIDAGAVLTQLEDIEGV